MDMSFLSLLLDFRTDFFDNVDKNQVADWTVDSTS